MVDHLFDAMEWFVTFMDGITPANFVPTMALILVLSYVHVLGHELGHAIAAWSRGLRVVVIRVGGALLGSVVLGATRVEFGIPEVGQGGGPAGYVLHRGAKRTPNDLVIIALAGPLASVLVAAAYAEIGATAHGNVSTAFILGSLEALWGAVGNLVPSRAGSAMMSDGRKALIAWSIRNEYAALTPSQREALHRELERTDGHGLEAEELPAKLPQPDPNHATSKAPPGF